MFAASTNGACERERLSQQDVTSTCKQVHRTSDLRRRASLESEVPRRCPLNISQSADAPWCRASDTPGRTSMAVDEASCVRVTSHSVLLHNEDDSVRDGVANLPFA